MGEVYRARDTRLDRAVAIKILPAELSQSAQFKMRFEREAKTISQLNHPHICTLYDVGENYLVMELLDGESLADHLARGPLSIQEVLRYGIQIAEALDRAHRQGVIHRDLKPGNVMLTKSGAKLLDFGLARSSVGAGVLAGSAAREAPAPTLAKPLTAEGTIVGTFQYMAPEQLEGVEADARTDIFALGALLYEMATGKRAFEGKTRTSLIAAIVSGRPTPVSQIQPLSPPALEHVIERCLEKDPADRWQSAHDVAEELKWIESKGSQAGVAAPITARRRTRERLSWTLNVLIAAVAVAVTWGLLELRKEPPRLVQSTILPPEKSRFAFEQAGAPALSPDGSRLAFPALAASGHTMLYVRSLSSEAAQPLAGTEDSTSPFWSPDSRFIAFFASGKLKKIEASGGPAQTVAEAPIGRGGSWSREGVIVFAPQLSGPIVKVSDAGGTVTPVTQLSPSTGETTHRWPCFLPDGHHFIYLANGQAQMGQRILLGSIEADLHRQLTLANANAIFSPSGHLVYPRERSLVAQAFDPKTLKIAPDLVPIAENIPRTSRLDACFTLSGDGKLVYQGGGAVPLSQLIWVDTTGKPVGQVGQQAEYSAVSVSHDGRRVMVGIVDRAANHSDLWIMDIARGTSTRLTFDPAEKISPSWSPDDSKILYSSNAKSLGDITIKNSSGTGSEEVLLDSPAFSAPSDWSPDGKTIAYMQLDPRGKTNWDIWLYSLADHKPHLFLQTPFAELQARFSPDGRWLSYVSNESGRSEIYVLPASGNGGKWQISTDGGTNARWGRDGKQLFYVSPDFKLMAVDVSAHGAEFIAGVPRALLTLNIKHANGSQYDISPDSKRFLVNTPNEHAELAPLTLVQNWTSALKK